MRGRPPVFGSGYTCIQTVGGGGRVEVARQSRLVEAVVANAGLVHEAGGGSPNPVTSDHLCASVNIGEPFLLQFGKVFDGAGVVSKKVGPADAAVVR